MRLRGGLDIDTRSDVYALGVVFYELLCGRLPYSVTRVAMHEATRVIREEQPTKLSTLNKTLRGDVETIALKALEKAKSEGIVKHLGITGHYEPLILLEAIRLPCMQTCRRAAVNTHSMA